MSKVVKILSVVAAGAFIIASGGLGAPLAAGLTGALGLSAGAIGAIATGLTIGASLLQKRPKAPSVAPDTIERMRASIQ